MTTRSGVGFYLFYLFIVTLAPYDFSIGRLTGPAHDVTSFFRTLFAFKPLDLAVNILLFLPLGLLLFPLLGPATPGRRGKKRLQASLSGLGLSALIESAQLFIAPRTCSVIDSAMNTLGAFLGCLIAERFADRRPEIRSRMDGWCRRRQPVLMALYVVAVSCVSVIPSRLNDFSGWRRDFPMIIGNEATGDRPWSGEVARLSIFDRALGGRDVRRLSQAGLNGFPARGSATLPDPVLDCPMTKVEGDSVLDCFGNGIGKRTFRFKGQSLRLAAAASGLVIDGERPLECADSCGILIDALKNASQMSISAWLRTDSLNQTGPARIVTVSINTEERDFTLAQDGHALVFRVRTRQAGPNGSKIHPYAAEAIRDRDWHHVAAVFNRGYGRIFLDGRPAGRPVRVPEDYLPDLFGMGTSLFSKIAFWTALLLPFGWMASRKADSRLRIWIGFASGLLLAAWVQGLVLWDIGQPFGF